MRAQLASLLSVVSLTVVLAGDHTQTLRAKPLACELDVPASWRVTTDKGGARITAGGDGVGIMLGAVPQNLGAPSAAVKFGREMASEQDPNAKVTEATPITIDGHKWLEFTNSAVLGGDATTFLVYVYSGPEGTFVVMGVAPTDMFESKRPLLTRYMNTFRFPMSAGSKPTGLTNR